jgi:hypothetical protein
MSHRLMEECLNDKEIRSEMNRIRTNIHSGLSDIYLKNIFLISSIFSTNGVTLSNMQLHGAAVL